MRVLVCGGRDFTDRFKLEKALADKIGFAGHPDLPRDVIIVGGAKGADAMAEQWADVAGHRIERYPADWTTHGKAAGPIRNQRMLDEGKPNLVIAFPGGRGTADMVRRAELAGVQVVRIQ